MTKNPTTTLAAATEGLDNDKRVRILGIIDKIRELGVAENVSLPQVSQDRHVRLDAYPA